MALKVVWIEDNELLLRGVPFSDDPVKKYVDNGALYSSIFSDRSWCPSVHAASSADLAALTAEESKIFCFLVLTTKDIRTNGLGEVIHNPNDVHKSHALIVPPPGKSKSQIKLWQKDLRNLVWDIVFISERVAQFR